MTLTCHWVKVILDCCCKGELEFHKHILFSLIDIIQSNSYIYIVMIMLHLAFIVHAFSKNVAQGHEDPECVSNGTKHGGQVGWSGISQVRPATTYQLCFYTPRNEVRGGILESPCPSICPSVCPAAFGFPARNCFPFTPIIMKLHMQTPHESRMCPIDFEVKRSKVKVTA